MKKIIILTLTLTLYIQSYAQDIESSCDASIFYTLPYDASGLGYYTYFRNCNSDSVRRWRNRPFAKCVRIDEEIDSIYVYYDKQGDSLSMAVKILGFSNYGNSEYRIFFPDFSGKTWYNNGQLRSETTVILDSCFILNYYENGDLHFRTEQIGNDTICGSYINYYDTVNWVDANYYIYKNSKLHFKLTVKHRDFNLNEVDSILAIYNYQRKKVIKDKCLEKKFDKNFELICIDNQSYIRVKKRKWYKKR